MTDRRTKPFWRILRGLGFLALALELTYVVGVAVFLNTPLFAKATGMEDVSATFVRAYGAWSIFPGRLRAREILVSIRDQNVEIDIHLHHARVPFDVRGLFHRRLSVRGLHVPAVDALIRQRSEAERARWAAAHPDPYRDRAIPEAEIERRRRSRWTIDVSELTLDQLRSIQFDRDRIEGNVAIHGGFRLYSGVEAEVYLSKVDFSGVRWSGGVSNLSGTASARFRPFSVPRTNGPEAMKYFDADATLSGKMEDLGFVNLTLRSLEGFGFARGHVDFRSSLSVRSGRIMPGSRFETPDGPLELKNDEFRVLGDGYVRWSVPPQGDRSRLEFLLRRATAHARVGALAIRAAFLRFGAQASIRGLDLRAPFTSLYGNVAIRRGTYAVSTDPGPNGLAWSAEGTIDGGWAGSTSGEPSAGVVRASDGIRIGIARGTARIPGLGVDGNPLSVEARGSIRTGGRPIVLTRQMALPGATLDLRVRDPALKKEGDDVHLHVAADGARLLPDVAHRKTWLGHARVVVDGLNAVLDRMRDAGVISGVLRIAAAADRLEARLGWQARSNYRRVIASSIRTDGTWAAQGNFASENGGRWLGLFSASVAGLPVAIAASPSGVEWKIDPRLRAGTIPPGSSDFVGGRLRETTRSSAKR